MSYVWGSHYSLILFLWIQYTKKLVFSPVDSWLNFSNQWFYKLCDHPSYCYHLYSYFSEFNSTHQSPGHILYLHLPSASEIHLPLLYICSFYTLSPFLLLSWSFLGETKFLSESFYLSIHFLHLNNWLSWTDTQNKTNNSLFKTMATNQKLPFNIYSSITLWESVFFQIPEDCYKHLTSSNLP